MNPSSGDQISVRDYYAAAPGREWDRLSSSADGHVEFALTRKILRDHLNPKSRVLDLGGGPGRYAVWLAQEGHRVTLADLSPELLQLARSKIESQGNTSYAIEIAQADACDLHRWPDQSFEAVVALGPFYHLSHECDRESAAREIARVLKPGGFLFAAFLSRWSFLRRVLAIADERDYLQDPTWIADLLERGVFRNPIPGRFSLGYGAMPEEIDPFLTKFGFDKVAQHAVESFAGGVSHQLETLEQDAPKKHERVLELLLRVSREPSIQGFYGHIVYVGKKHIRSTQSSS